MNVNHLGKALVLITLVLSILLLTWASLLFFQPVDWGWLEPRKAYGGGGDAKKENERIAARIDERVAAHAKYVEAKMIALANLKPAQETLDKADHHVGFNRRLYRAELARLERPKIPADQLALAAKLTAGKKAAAKFEVRAVKFTPKELLALEPDRPWGWPVLEKVVEVDVFTVAGKTEKLKIEKTYQEYFKELVDKLREVHEVSTRISTDEKDKEGEPKGWVRKLQKQTVWLNGQRDDKDGKLLEPGLYQLLDLETEHQRKLKDELEALGPMWSRELSNAQLLRGRREGLEKRLMELGVNPSEVLGQ